MSQPLVLIIDDDQRLAAMVETYLAQNGLRVEHACTAQAGLDRLAQAAPGSFSALILDLMLPDLDGLEVCRRLRGMPQPLRSLPVLMLTAKGDPLDRVIGLELGADDYLPKPFEPRELLARLRALLRRPTLAGPAGASGAEPPLRFGRLEIDPGARIARVDGAERPLTAYQFDLLMAFAHSAGRVLSREQLIDALKGGALEPFDRSIDVHVGRVRAAIEDDPKAPRRIITVRGAGYVFAKVQDA
ncbi:MULTISPECIES: response regulator [unclassified Duganella]|uniref:response regulator n=1 Tax=unclassified Duganella TaxID=2636909 RepID=UPI0006F2DF01|nr:MULTISPECIES: response regulator transcription factor [unclassified Duganella]KQV59143.1 two-component system response regulator [Duganella sp. Root336D2]KRB97349.1 two-component system response regulator [Duganella sp. Root198D2]